MKNIFYVLTALALLAFPYLVRPANAEEKSFRNNTGMAAYYMMRSMPSEMREDFREKMLRHRKQWHGDMKKMHKQMKTATEQLKNKLEKGKVNKTQVDKIFQPLQNRIEQNGERAMKNIRGILAEVIANASDENREEMVAELEEVLEDWENYEIRPRRWWQLWR
jgi:hypothetical protein